MPAIRILNFGRQGFNPKIFATADLSGEGPMKLAKLAILGAVLAISAAMLAQDKTVPEQAHDQRSAKTLVVMGKVSEDGKKLMTDLDSEWSVSNAEVLKGQEGHMVRVKCYVDSEKSKLQILSVKREGGASTMLADSAFRR
jgi:hypothetical protein